MQCIHSSTHIRCKTTYIVLLMKFRNKSTTYEIKIYGNILFILSNINHIVDQKKRQSYSYPYIRVLIPNGDLINGNLIILFFSDFSIHVVLI